MVPHSFLFFSLSFSLYFIFDCAGPSLLCMGFLQLRQVGTALHFGVWASPCGGFSCCISQALECRLSSCGSWVWLLCSVLNLPGPGVEPVSPGLGAQSLNPRPPGESLQ